MESIELESSEDDENIYVNAVARLKALKNHPICKHKQDYDKEKINENVTEKESDVGPITSLRGRRKQRGNSKKITRAKNDYFTSNISINLDTIQNENEHTTRHSMVLRSNKGKKKGRPKKTQKKNDVSSDSTIVVDSEIIAIDDDDHELVYNSVKDNPLVLTRNKDDNNEEMNVKVLWRNKIIHRINMYKHDSFEKAFEYFADLEKVSVKQILLMNQDKIINMMDTPLSLNLQIIDILDGGLLNPDVADLNIKSNQCKIDEDICNVTVQTENKKTLVIPVRKNQQFKELFSNCADQLGIPVSSIKLYFDGEQVGVNDTPESLDLDQEACMDLLISKR